MVRKIKAKEPVQQLPLTPLQKFISKAERGVEDAKHLEVKDALIQYVFPALRKLAESDAELSDSLDGVEERVQEVEEDQEDGAIFDALQAARDQIIKQAAFIDQIMVMGQFFTASEKGLEPTSKLNEALSMQYASLAADAKNTIFSVQESLNAFEEGEEDGDDGDGDDDDDGGDGGDVVTGAVAVETEGGER